MNGSMKLRINKLTIVILLMTVLMLCCAAFIRAYTLNELALLGRFIWLTPWEMTFFVPNIMLGIALFTIVIYSKLAEEGDVKSRSAIVAWLLFLCSIALMYIVRWWSDSVLFHGGR
jgi:hypothetical protein